MSIYQFAIGHIEYNTLKLAKLIHAHTHDGKS